MANLNLVQSLLIYLAILGFVLLLLVKYKEKLWPLFRTLFFPLLLTGLFAYNLISFPALDWFTIFPYNQGRLQRLPSNELIDLLENGTSQSRTEWIYPLVEIYYQGRTLYSPDGLLESLELSQELLQTQGYLAAVMPLQLDRDLTQSEVDLILDVGEAQILMTDGNEYHFVTCGMGQDSSLLLLQYGNQVFFVPEGILPDWERGS